MRDTRGDEAGERRLEIHNVSVDERLARADLCGQVHLPSGGTCVLPYAHTGSCRFVAPDDARHVVEDRPI